MSRRTELAVLIPIVLEGYQGHPVHTNVIYKHIQALRPDLVDDEPDPYTPTRLKWEHDVRWELQSGVTDGRIVKREDVGRGYYSSPSPAVKGAVSVRGGDAAEVRIGTIEKIHRESSTLRKAIASQRVMRTEVRLVQRYEAWLAPQGISVGRVEFRPPGGGRLVADVYDPQRNLLIEAKAKTQRSDVRMAIGQLFDYAFLLGTRPSLALLLPTAPSASIDSLLTSCRIGSVSESSPGNFNESLV